MTLTYPWSGLVADADARWQAKGRDKAAFVEIAQTLLEEAALHEALSHEALMTHLASQPLPTQLDPHERFGEPPVTLHHGGDFVLDVYFWSAPVVSIHDHSFAGAFAIHTGLSLHTTYRVEVEELHPGLGLGQIELTDAELLRPGCVRPIASGDAFVHQVAHLSPNCVSVVLRTARLDDTAPTHDYLAPSIKLRRTDSLTALQHKKLSVLQLFWRQARNDALALSHQLLADEDALMLAWGLRYTSQATQSVEAMRQLAEMWPEHAWTSAFVEAVAFTDSVAVQWAYIPDPGVRLFILLCKYITNPELRDRLVDAFQPGWRFRDGAMRWTGHLGQLGLLGGLAPFAPLALGVCLDGGGVADVAAEIAKHHPEYSAEAVCTTVATQLIELFESHPLFARLLERRVDG